MTYRILKRVTANGQEDFLLQREVHVPQPSGSGLEGSRGWYHVGNPHSTIESARAEKLRLEGQVIVEQTVVE